MCRNIKPLFNFAPPATDDEVRASALQFVRKVSGFTKPSKANEAAFNDAVDEVTAAALRLIGSLVTAAPPQEPGGVRGQGAGTSLRALCAPAALTRDDPGPPRPEPAI